jgi:hypothetical protein
MAVLTANLGLVFGSLRLYGCGLLGVAMDTMRIGQRRHFSGIHGLYMTTKYHKRHNNYSQTAEKNDAPFSA